MKNKLYHYRAVVTSVYDGDTCTVNLDLGLGTWIHDEKIRLARINAPEMRGSSRAQAQASRDFLREQIDDQSVYIQTIRDKKGKYGRYLAELWLPLEEWVNVNDLMVVAGHAEYKVY